MLLLCLLLLPPLLLFERNTTQNVHSWLIGTLRTPWSWQKYCLNHCARTCCSLHIVTRCRFTNWQIGCERGGRNVHFLSINLISFRWSRGIVLVKLRVFRSGPNPHRHRQRHWQSASSLGRCLWLARFVSVWKAPPPVMLRHDQSSPDAVVVW